ncbi:MAG: (2Fe-2S)-binding protein [Acidobacteria bacterium RBG_16_64_8]|nr:MAG: (2Fe-2S)-binding protein [Acidobacteria bacterium RBG_16_64_8]
MTRVTVEGRDLLLARVGDRYYSVDDHCPHMGGRLSHGTLDGTTVTCPRHGSQFDITTGRVLRWTHWTGIKLALAKMLKSPRPVKVYPVRTEAERVQVDLE